jgi:ATP-dependent helicase HrpB
VTAALRATGTAVLVAPRHRQDHPDPQAVADCVDDRVVIAQPARWPPGRRRAGWRRLLGEQVGERVGYAVRGERRSGPRTRIEVVTTGLLVRRLHHDPELPGTGAVLLDECHERQLDADLALAFAVEARGALRPDLWLLAMSATAEAERFAALLGTGTAPAPVVRAESALHPVTRVWTPPPRPVAPAAGGRVDPALLDHVAATVRRALAECDGDLLVFCRVRADLRSPPASPTCAARSPAGPTRPDAARTRTPRASADRRRWCWPPPAKQPPCRASRWSTRG